MLVIGAGPAGLACAIAAAQNGEPALVLEKKQQPGKKLLLSGNGQCNLTHTGSIGDFLQHYGPAEKGRFVKPSLFAFPNTAILRFFEDRGVPLFYREDGKVFPQSLKSGDILQTLLAELKRCGGQCRTGIEILNIGHTVNGFCVETRQGNFCSGRLALATGGFSFPKTGSTGEGYRWAEQFGHTIITPKPALTPIVVDEYHFADAAGIVLENIAINIFRKNKKIRQGKGDVLFTHSGLSGPGILDLSRYIEPFDTLRLPLIASGTDFNALLYGKKILKNALIPLGIPDRLLHLVLHELGIVPETAASETNQKTRQRLQAMLSDFPFVVRQLGGFNEAMATNGGIALDGVNRQTLESRIVPGLFFCGELLDIDGDTGGYNIQFALSSGFLAGSGKQTSR